MVDNIYHYPYQSCIFQVASLFYDFILRSVVKKNRHYHLSTLRTIQYTIQKKMANDRLTS